MADQQDKSPDSSYEGLFSSSYSESKEDRAVEDIVAEDISDFDDDSEEGIFAPAPERKKERSNSALLGTVAVIAIIGGGAFFAVNNPELMSGLKQNLGLSEEEVSSPVTPLETPPVAEIPMADSPVTPLETPPVAEIPMADSPVAPTVETADVVPQPDQIVNAEPPVDAAEVAVPTPEPAPDTVSNSTPEVAADVASVPAAEQMPEPVPAEEPQALETPEAAPTDSAALDIPVETVPVDEAAAAPQEMAQSTATSEPVEKTEPLPTEAPVEAPIEASQPPPSQSTEVAVSSESAPDAPAQETLVEAPKPENVAAAAPPAPAAVETSVSGSDGTAKVTAPKEKSETTYFDSPPGEALKQIPAPSLNPKRDAGGSSIMVVTDAIKASDLESRVVAANRAFRLGMYDSALDLYTQLYKINPRDERILMGRAVTMQKLGDTNGAIKAYEELLNVAPGNPDAIVNLMGLIRKEYPAVALNKLLDLRQKYPNNAGIAAQLGVAYADAGNLEDSYRYLGLASNLEPNNPQHYFNMAVVAEKMKNPRVAISMYEKALEVDAVHGSGRSISRDTVYDRLSRLRGN